MLWFTVRVNGSLSSNNAASQWLCGLRSRARRRQSVLRGNDTDPLQAGIV